MGRAKPVELPSIRFATQREAEEYFKAMLAKYRDGDRIGDDDEVLLRELLLRHPDDKIRAGVEYFYRAKSTDYPTSCFHVKRVDGGPTDFSYGACIKGTKQSLDEYFYRACRSAVGPYLTEEKNEQFRAEGVVRCCSTGEILSKETSEYRHTTPRFWELVREFRIENQLVLKSDMFVEDRDMQYTVRFNEPALAEDFVGFHKSHATLAMFRTGVRP